MDDPGSIKLPLSPARYTTFTAAVRGCWCLQVHLIIYSAFARGVHSVTWVDLEAQSWIADFRIAAALNIFLFFLVVCIGGLPYTLSFDVF